MQKNNPAKRRPERLVVTLLSLLFLSTAVFATVKYVFRAPELDTDKHVVQPDGLQILQLILCNGILHLVDEDILHFF